MMVVAALAGNAEGLPGAARTATWRRTNSAARAGTLRANDGETSESLKFSLEGEGQPSWSCNTRKLIPTVLPGLVVTEDRASCRPRRRRRPRCRLGLDVGDR